MELTDREWSILTSAVLMSLTEWRNRANDNLVDFQDLPLLHRKTVADRKDREQVRQATYKMAEEYEELWAKLRIAQYNKFRQKV